MPSPADLGALLSAQERLIEACARSGRILAEAARDCAERQAAIGRSTLRDLWSAGPLGLPAATPGEPASLPLERLGGLVQAIAGELGAMQRILAEAQLAVLEELRRALAPERPAEPAAAAEPAPPAAPAEPPAAVAAPPAEAAEPAVVEAAAPAEPPLVAAAAAGEPGRPRRARKVEARG